MIGLKNFRAVQVGIVHTGDCSLAADGKAHQLVRIRHEHAFFIDRPHLNIRQVLPGRRQRSAIGNQDQAHSLACRLQFMAGDYAAISLGKRA